MVRCEASRRERPNESSLNPHCRYRIENFFPSPLFSCVFKNFDTLNAEPGEAHLERERTTPSAANSNNRRVPVTVWSSCSLAPSSYNHGERHCICVPFNAHARIET
jgi:hypothetical protein